MSYMSDKIKAWGLKAGNTERIYVGNFDVPQNHVERVVYTDDKGYEYAYLWGAFYRLERIQSVYSRYRVSVIENVHH